MPATTSIGLPTRLACVAALSGMIVLAALGLSALGHRRHEEPAPLPVLGRVADFALVDQASSPVSRAALSGGPWVANFVFTRCTSVCPRLTNRMRAVQTLAQRDDAGLRLVSFSVDPEHDDPAALKTYADANGADLSSWEFLTGSEASIKEIARSFSVALDGEADPSRSDFGIMHSGHLVLVDGRGRIRGYYPSSEEGVEQRILIDLKRLGAS